MTRLLVSVLLLVGAALGAAACAGTHQVMTAPPVPATAPAALPAAAARARLAVHLGAGVTTLPPDVARLRFRVDEVWLKPVLGAWTAYPAGVHFVVDGTVAAGKALLAAAIPPVVYDSLALRIADVYVEFDANAGAPLTLPRDMPLRVPVDFRADVDAVTTLRLVFEPGASLTRTPDGRWIFMPFLTVTGP